MVNPVTVVIAQHPAVIGAAEKMVEPFPSNPISLPQVGHCAPYLFGTDNNYADRRLPPFFRISKKVLPVERQD
jgi:hypothetical protein